MSDNVLSVDGVSKKYCRGLKRGMLYSMGDVCRDAIGIRSATERLRAGEFWAVSDVSFSLKRGECMGLIGANGAGKSTLLKMLNGIIRPDTGAIRMKGRVRGADRGRRGLPSDADGAREHLRQRRDPGHEPQGDRP